MHRADIIGTVLFVTATPAAAQLVSAELIYPPAELKAGIQGVVTFEIEVTKDGKVSKCKITQTSGNADLDKQTCIQLRQTGRFKAAVDPTGRPIKSTYVSKLRWSIPHAASETQRAAAAQ